MELLHEIRAVMRGLLRDWRFAVAFVVPLSLGLGAGATFYSIIDQVLFRPPAGVADPGALVQVADASPEYPDPFAIGNVSVAWEDYDALRRHASTLTGVAGYVAVRQSLGRGEDARTIPTMFATASYFPLLGVHPRLGRLFGPDEDMTTAAVVPCVAGDRFWRTSLGGSAAALDTTLAVGTLECRVVGVMPAGFNGTGYTPVDLWLPLRAGAEGTIGGPELWSGDRSRWISLLARVKAGVARTRIDQDLTRAYRSVAGRIRDPQLTGGMAAAPLLGRVYGTGARRVALARWLVGGAAVLLLLIGANLVNLLVARNLGRIRETAIRMALGGGRARLFARALLECALLAVAAAAASVGIVAWAAPVVRAVLFPGVSFAAEPLSARVAVLAGLVSLLAGGAIGALTAWYAGSVDPATLLNAAGGVRTGTSRRSQRARLVLVGVQAALSVSLLVASAAFVRSFRVAASTDLGFDPRGLLFADIPSLWKIDSTTAGQLALYEDVRRELRSMPGVTGVSLGYMSPWWNNRQQLLRIPGRDSLPMIPHFGSPAFDAVTPDYLATMGMTLEAGRWITADDGAGAAPVMVVSDALARFYWPGERKVLGKCIVVGDVPACRQIVGVVRGIRFTGALDGPDIPSYYLPIAQAAAYGSGAKVFVRVAGDPAAMLPAIRHVVQGARPGLPAADVRTMQDQIDPLLAPWRLGAMAFTALGTVAAAVAMLGLFSILARLVAERRGDFAIRRALGARTPQIVAPVLARGVGAVAAGAGAGLLVTAASRRWLEPLLFHVRLMDPVAAAVIVAATVAVAVAAALAPARRASLADPMDALRAE